MEIDPIKNCHQDVKCVEFVIFAMYS